MLLFFHQGKKRRSQKASLPRRVCLSPPINHKKKCLLPVGCRGATAYAPLMPPKGASCTYPNRSIRPRGGRSGGVCHTPLPYRQEKAFNPLKQIGIHTFSASPMPARIGKSMPPPYPSPSRFGRLRPPAKFAPSRFGYIPYPANFPGLGRGLDLLLPSFLPSREGRLRPPAKFAPSRFRYAQPRALDFVFDFS